MLPNDQVPTTEPTLDEPVTPTVLPPSDDMEVYAPPTPVEEATVPPVSIERAPQPEFGGKITMTDDTQTLEDQLLSIRSEPLRILGAPQDLVTDALRVASTRMEGTADTVMDWAEIVQDSYANSPRQGTFAATLARENADWGQGMEHADKLWRMIQQRIPVSGGAVLTGDAALAKVVSAMGMGAIVRVPLWHTGIWVDIKAPSDVALYELERRIANEKISLGRLTKGLLFSNSSVYTMSHVVSFILNHIHSSTAPKGKESPADLRTIIRVSDIPSLVWGLVSAIYPGGYPYEQACTVDPTKCREVVRAKLNITKLQWVDRSVLSEEQKRHMTRRTVCTTMDALRAYQDAFKHIEDASTRRITDNISIKMRMPSIADYELSGFSWVEGIVSATDEAFGQSFSETGRNNHIMDAAKTMTIRQYSHWLGGITIMEKTGEESEITATPDIEAATVWLSSNDSVKSKMLAAIAGFIDQTTASVIGVANYNCPKCGERLLKGDGPKTRIIPIDMMAVFSNLLRLRLDLALKDPETL